jgi:tRNA pseudouridine65 synthase
VSKALHHAFAAHEMKKTYWAVIHGRTPEAEWDCTEPIQKESDKPIRDAHTSFRLLETVRHPTLSNLDEDKLSLIAATPHSGRFHQIRRHLVHAGFPIIGDYRYGGIERCDQLGDLLGIGSRMLLMAKKLEFIHPVTKESVIIEADTDPMFEKCFLG